MASYRVDAQGFLVDSAGTRVGFKEVDGDEVFFARLNAAQDGLLKADGTALSIAGVTAFASLTDKTTVDLPTVNTPLAVALGLLAPKAAPTFTGIPLAPTAAQGTNTTQLATTAFVIAELAAAGRLRFGSGVPGAGLGADGDGYVRTDAPYAGVLYLKAAGAWAVAQGTYTWAGKPSAVGNSGAVITISDWNADFFSDGTNWIPIGKALPLASATAASVSRTVGTAASQTAATISIPAGLIIPGCKITFSWMWDFLGTGASTKNVLLDDSLSSGLFLHSRGTLAANVKQASDIISLRVSDSSASFAWSAPNGSGGDNNVGSTSTNQTWTINLASAHSWRFRTVCAVDEQWQLAHYDVSIKYK